MSRTLVIVGCLLAHSSFAYDRSQPKQFVTVSHYTAKPMTSTLEKIDLNKLSSRVTADGFHIFRVPRGVKYSLTLPTGANYQLDRIEDTPDWDQTVYYYVQEDTGAEVRIRDKGLKTVMVLFQGTVMNARILHRHTQE